jgi:methionyl-tRNA formyltransferase
MKNKIHVVLMSGTDIGCRFADALKNNGNVNLSLVVTGCDKPCGRGRKLKRAEVARYCDSDDINVYQPENINSEEARDRLKKTNADMAIVVDYGQILSKSILGLFPMGAYNFHYSVLPDLRGPEPIRWALIKGYVDTGVTLIKMDEYIDTGAIADIRTVRISVNDNYESLREKLTDEALRQLRKLILSLSKGESITLITQQMNKDLMYARKFDKEACRIDWNESSDNIVNKIKAFSPRPGCYSLNKKNNTVFKFIMAENIKDFHGKPGFVEEIGKDCFIVAAKEGGIKIIKIQPAGKRIMDVKEYFAGNVIEKGDIFI